jgi:penicillin-binding protein 1A
MAESEIDKKNRPKQAKKRSIFKRFLQILYLTLCLLAVAAGVAGGGAYFYFTRDLPKISTLKDYSPPIITTVYSDDNRKIAEFYRERRIVVPISKIPKILIDAFVAAEDARFYEHEGIDLFGIARAFVKNIEAGSIVQGGSTITQQVAKSFFLSMEKSYSRKIR